MAFTIKQNDTLPNLTWQIFQPDRVTPLDLTNAEAVSIIVANKSTNTMAFKKACVVSTPLQGRGYYAWEVGDTGVVGAFVYEFEIEWNNGKIQTVPVDGYFDLVVVDDLG